MSENSNSPAESLARRARQSARALALVPAADRNRAIAAIAAALRAASAAILSANAADLDAARRDGLSAALIDRLTLTPQRLESMARSLDEIHDQTDPVGEIISRSVRPSGLTVERVRVPIGVVFIIFESRPNVITDAAALCLKSANASILRGGKEALNSNRALYAAIRSGLAAAGLSPDTVQFVDTADYAFVESLLRQDRWIDLVIPRGGERLIRAVVEHTAIPVIKHYKGVCHVYIDEFADLEMAAEIALNAKCQRPATCNAMETLLVHRVHAGAFLKSLLERFAASGVEIRGCPRVLAAFPAAKPATEDDWAAEYLDLILAVRVTDNLEEAIDHIARYGSNHTDAIVTQDAERAEMFIRAVDSSSVMVNASTRFADGGLYGLGAEVGISTDKLHARGPMGAADLTTYKYVVRGTGQVRT